MFQVGARAKTACVPGVRSGDGLPRLVLQIQTERIQLQVLKQVEEDIELSDVPGTPGTGLAAIAPRVENPRRIAARNIEAIRYAHFQDEGRVPSVP